MKAITRTKTGLRKPKSKRLRMPKFFPVDQETRHCASLIENEVARWPNVRVKPMFGMAAFFRKNAIFAAVPRTRTLRSPQSIIMKFHPVPDSLVEKIQAESRIADRAPGPGAGWHAFELSSPDDIRDALWWLNQAYDCAGKSKR